MKGYEKTGDDNGRCEGTFDSLSAEHVVAHFDYGKRDTVGETGEVVEETTEDGEY